VVRSEAQLLRSHGVEVRELMFENERDGASGLGGMVRIALDSAWSRPSYRRVVEACDQFLPDVVHVHNFWMQLSPSVHAASQIAGVPTVQTLHNFRLLCANALLYRDGAPCADCIGKAPWRGVVRRCYRHSVLASTAVAAMTVVNRTRNTWENEVNAFVALSEHSRRQFAAGGLPLDRVFVKPNFVTDPGLPLAPSSSKIVLFGGRFSPEKGVGVFLSAWAQGGIGRYGRLVLAGDGPERPGLERTVASLGLASSVDFVGHRSPSEIADLISNCRAVVVPSLCYENFPRMVVEAFAHGKPVIVSDVGALREIVDTDTGIRFPPGDSVAMADALCRVLRNDRLADSLGDAARAEYLNKYTPERNFGQLMTIYRFATRESCQFNGSYSAPAVSA
jgi:glycosyltransferase involved in cell wall biosynthesis